MKIAVVQLVSSADPQANLELVREHVADAARQSAELVLFPEATMRTFGDPDVSPTLVEAAEPLDGPWANAVRDIAKEHGVAVAVGMFTPGRAGAGGAARVRNTFLFTSESAEASYDKIHLYDAWNYRESDTIDAGTEPVTVTYKGVTFGLATCFDLRFPRLFLNYAQHKVDAILVNASWSTGPSKVHHWLTLAQARALDATCYLLAADQANPSTIGLPAIDAVPTGLGHSIAVAPNGEPIYTAGDAPEVFFIDVDTAESDAVRELIPMLDAPALEVRGVARYGAWEIGA